MGELDKALQEELTFGGLDAKTKRWLKRQQKGSKPRSEAITPVEYSGLQAAYDHFNRDRFSFLTGPTPQSSSGCIIPYEKGRSFQ